jgi:hypothetical protein
VVLNITHNKQTRRRKYVLKKFPDILQSKSSELASILDLLGTEVEFGKGTEEKNEEFSRTSNILGGLSFYSQILELPIP